MPKEGKKDPEIDTIFEEFDSFENDLKSYGNNIVNADKAFGSEDKDLLKETVSNFGLEYIDNSWRDRDKALVFLASLLGITVDILINQTTLLKPLDLQIKGALSESDFQKGLEKFNKSLHDGGSNPIDFQDFEMHGLKNLHEQYSFGHDLLRPLNGIYQIMSGQYMGVDKLGNLIKRADFGNHVPNFFAASISWFSHLMADFCNKLSLPYPGSTFLMEHGPEKLRSKIAAAYRNGDWNARTFAYQGLAPLLVNFIFTVNNVLENLDKTGEFSFAPQNTVRWREMRITANAIVVAQNLAVNGARAYFGDPKVFFRINTPAMMMTIKEGVLLLNENRITLKKIKGKNKALRESIEQWQTELKAEDSRIYLPPPKTKKVS